ncbi:hypothetical protein RQP46_009968 [Phenoliferia psychrophenolica]
MPMTAFRLLVGLGANLLSFAQVLLYLPLALDIAGKEAMLALSLLLSVIFAFQATIHLITRNTRLRPLARFFTILQPLLIPTILLLTLNLYSDSHSSFSPKPNVYLAALRNAPRYWEIVLRTSSPLFVILEGMSTLLCIQAFSRFSMDRIEQSRSPDLLQLVFLTSSAIVYVLSAYFLWESYDSVPDRISATLIGVTVTSIVFLSGISFALQKGNVVETSLMLACVPSLPPALSHMHANKTDKNSYAVFQIFHLSSRPEMYSAGIWQQIIRSPGTNGHPPLPPLVLRSLDAISSLATHTVGAGVEFVTAVSSALPLPVLVGLFYRVAVMYAASRIVLALKKRNEGYEETKKLSEEEPAARVMTVIVTYARLILIAGPLSLSSTGTLFHTPNASFTCPTFHLLITGGVGPWTLYALNDTILQNHITDPKAAAIKYIGASAYQGVDFSAAQVEWEAGTKVDFFVVDSGNQTAITKTVEVREFDAGKCKIQHGVGTGFIIGMVATPFAMFLAGGVVAGAFACSPSGPLHLTTTGTLFHSPNASYTCPKFQLVLTGGIEPWTLYALNDSILLSHLADPTAAAIRYIGASSYRNVDFPSATDWTAGTSIDFFVVDGEKSTAITSSTMVLEFDEKKCKMGETELSWGEQWRIAGFVFLTMGVIFGLSLATSGTLFHAPNASYTCPPFQLIIGGGVGPWTLFALNDSILPLHIANPLAAAVKHIGTSAFVRSVDFPSSAYNWEAGSSIDFFVVDQASSTAITGPVTVLAFDQTKCKIE